MNNDKSGLYSIAVGTLSFVAFILLFMMLLRLMAQSNVATFQLPLLLITGVMALFATLALVAVTFSVAGLSDKSQALGLPEGSVRAAIALSLIVIFAITAIFLFSSMSAPTPAGVQPNTRGDDFGKQVFAVVGTLMTSVVSFYFASRAATSAASTPLSTPTLINVAPTQAVKMAEPAVVGVRISGTGLQLAKTVKLQRSGGNTVLATDVSSSEDLIKCDFRIEPTLAEGKYDVVVTNGDGAMAALPGSFDVLPQVEPHE
jgi:hypothetical protein